MKKSLFLVISLCVVASLQADLIKDAKKGLEKTGKKIKKQTAKAASTVKKKVVKPAGEALSKSAQAVSGAAKEVASKLSDPTKLAKDASLAALKTIGINVKGISGNVAEIKVAIPKLQQDMAAVQAAVKAPKSPQTMAPVLTQKITAFQKELAALQKKIVNPQKIKTALGSAEGLKNMLSAVMDSAQKGQLNKTYKAYDAMLGAFDDVEINPILQSARKTVLDAAGVLDNVLEIRDNTGTLAKVVIKANIASAVRGISKSLHTIAANLNSIIQGGRRSMRSAAPRLVGSFLQNITKASQLVTDLQAAAKALPPHIEKMNEHIGAMVKLKDQLATTSGSIGTRLETLMKEKIKTVKGTFDAPRAAVVELKKIMNELKTQIDGIFANARDAIAQAGDAIMVGVNGMGAFKKNIGFDVVPEAARAGYTALPGSVKGLSQNVERLRKALPLEVKK